MSTFKLRYPIEKVLIDGLAAIKNRESLLVRIDTDEGIFGIGECAAFWVMSTVETFIHEKLKPVLLGENPLFVEKHWDAMFKATYRHGRRGIALIGISGVDVALWDILAKAANLPLYQVLGAYRERVPAYASGGYTIEGQKPEELAAEMAGYAAQGFKAVKMKVGILPYKEDIERVKAVREAIGPDIALMIDANNAWDPVTAMKVLKELESTDIYFLEEPVSTDDLAGSARVAASTTVPIAGYETEYTRFGYRELITRQAVDIVQPDPTWTGGLTECRRIAALASAFNLLCIPHSYASQISLVTCLHFLASLPNGGYLELGQDDNSLRDALAKPAVTIDKDGYVTLPERPGLGLEIDERMLREYAV